MRRALLALAVLAALSCTGTAGEPPPLRAPETSEKPPVLPAYTPAPTRIRRLLSWQYVNAVRDLLGPEAAAAVRPPPDAAVNGFDAVGAGQLALSPSAVRAYETSAFAAAEAALAANPSLLGCDPAAPECLPGFVDRFGPRALRRPLTAEERVAYGALGDELRREQPDLPLAPFAGVIAAMLQAPDFLFLVEIGARDPSNMARLRLTPHELAAKLSFFLTGTTPDAALLASADSGALVRPEELEAQARRLLQKPEARAALRSFFDELFRLRKLTDLSKDPERFPGWTPALRASLRESALRFLDELAWDGGDFLRVFDADFAYADADLSFLYGVPQGGAELRKITLPPEQRRGGILGQAGPLAVLAHAGTSSPTHRGKYVREVLLCEGIPSPPPNFSTSLPEPGPGEPARTTRERLEDHMKSSTCRSCHALMDPIGFGLEAYDGAGAFRTLEEGLPVDDRTELDGLPFRGARELGALLRADPRTRECLVRNLYRHAHGRIETGAEARPIADLTAAWAERGHDLRELLVAVVAHESFAVAAREVTP